MRMQIFTKICIRMGVIFAFSAQFPVFAQTAAMGSPRTAGFQTLSAGVLPLFGWDSRTGTPKNIACVVALSSGLPADLPSSPTWRSSGIVNQISTEPEIVNYSFGREVSDFFSATSASIQLQAAYGGYGGDFRNSTVSSRTINRFSEHVVINVEAPIVDQYIPPGTTFDYTSQGRALRSAGAEAFRATCGDSFVVAIQRGGAFTYLGTARTSTDREQQAVRTSFAAAVTYAGSDASGKTQTESQVINSLSTVSYAGRLIRQTSSTSGPALSNLIAWMNYAGTFKSSLVSALGGNIANDNPALHALPITGIRALDYMIIDGMPDAPPRIPSALEAITARLNEYRQLVSDLDYVIASVTSGSEEFFPSDSIPLLNGSLDTALVAIENVEKLIRICLSRPDDEVNCINQLDNMPPRVSMRPSRPQRFNAEVQNPAGINLISTTDARIIYIALRGTVFTSCGNTAESPVSINHPFHQFTFYPLDGSNPSGVRPSLPINGGFRAPRGYNIRYAFNDTDNPLNNCDGPSGDPRVLVSYSLQSPSSTVSSYPPVPGIPDRVVP